jgi:glucose-1-phosphate adenylyltransferase
VGAHHDVRGFIEKPAAAVLAANGEPTVLASMGIYVFDSQYLASVLARDALRGESGHDFGSDILPDAVREARVFAYSFTEPDGRPGYWRDVGTLESYWQAHMELLAPEPHIDLHDPAWPFRTNATALAPARVICNAGQCSAISSSLLSGGTLVRGAQVTSSVLSPNVSVGEGTVLEEVVALPNVRIGSNCRLRRVVIASEVQVADGTVAGGGRVSLLTGELPRPDLRCVA